MAETRISVSEAIDEAMAFTREAWRAAWAPMGLVAAGWMLIVVGGRAQLAPDTANVVRQTGWALLLAYWPLLGALYRFGVGGRAYRDIGPGGLQLGETEWRVLAVNAVLAFLFLLALTPLVLMSGLSYMVFRRLGSVNLGPAGPWAWWFLVSSAFGAAFFVALAFFAGRLSMATPLSVERRRTLPFSGWSLTEGLGRTIAIAFALAHVPALAAWLALQAFGWIEPADVPVGMSGAWPLPEAAGAGLIVGLVLSAVQAPLSVGLLTSCYDLLAPPDQDRTSSPLTTPDAAPELERPSEDDPAAAPEPEPESEPEPEPDPDPPFSTVEFFPHTGHFSRIAAPWLADEPAPEPYARWFAPPRPPKTETPEPQEPPEPLEPETYPHSVVEYSTHSGRFSRLSSPWLAHEDEVSASEEAETAPASAESEHEAHAEAMDAEPEVPEGAPPPPPALDGAGEAEHAEP